MATITLGQRLTDARGRPSGFDYLRLVLAAMVIVIHAPWITLGTAGNDMIWHAWPLPFVRFIVPMFFALSGFLVAGSFERSHTLLKFFGLRIIRIAPALVVETMLSALILGPMLTELPLKAYFSDPLFWTYFKNMLGEPQYFLPGMFVHSPVGQVNYQLWTIPFELACYVAIALVGLAGGRSRRIIAPAAMVLATLGYLAARYVHWHSFPELDRPMPGPLLVVAFLAGVTTYLYRDKLSASLGTGVALVAVCLVLLALPGPAQFLAPLPVAWLTAWVGTLDPRRIGLLRGADYSYGLYLYGFPLEQTVVRLFPNAHSSLLTIAAALVVGSAFAAFSWHFIEKPALRLRVVLDHLERRYKPRAA